MALGAFRQAWNALLEQRDRDLKRNDDNRGKDVRVMEARRDNIGIILQQARAALGIEISDNGLGNEEEGASDSEGEPAVTSVPPSNTSEGQSTPAEGENRRPSLVDRSELTLARQFRKRSSLKCQGDYVYGSATTVLWIITWFLFKASTKYVFLLSTGSMTWEILWREESGNQKIAT